MIPTELHNTPFYFSEHRLVVSATRNQSRAIIVLGNVHKLYLIYIKIIYNRAYYEKQISISHYLVVGHDKKKLHITKPTNISFTSYSFINLMN